MTQNINTNRELFWRNLSEIVSTAQNAVDMHRPKPMVQQVQ
jgi:hypothetical protein